MDSVAALLVRSFSFIFVFSLFPSRLIPFSLRLSVALVLLIFGLPLIMPATSILSFSELVLKIENLLQTWIAQPLLTTAVVREFAYGLFLALFAACGALIAQLVGSWLAGLFQVEIDFEQVGQSGKGFEYAVVLLYCLSLLPLLPAIISAFSESLLIALPAATSDSQALFQINDWQSIVLPFGKMMLLFSIILLLPFFGVTILLLMLALPANRIFGYAISDSLMLAFRQPLLLLTLFSVFFVFADGLVRMPKALLPAVHVESSKGLLP